MHDEQMPAEHAFVHDTLAPSGHVVVEAGHVTPAQGSVVVFDVSFCANEKPMKNSETTNVNKITCDIRIISSAIAQYK